MNMRVPLQTATKGVENTNETGSIIFRFIKFLNMKKMESAVALKRQLSNVRSFLKKDLNSSRMVKTQCL